jgi:hypothetical protein
MKGYEIIKQIKEQRMPDHLFIKWWRKENDFLDYDLLDRFVNNYDDSHEISGFELLGIEPMWQELQRICGDRVAKTKKDGAELLAWERETGERQECMFTPQSLITVFDVETKGNPVD